MYTEDFDSLAQATNALTKNGYKDGFTAKDNKIVGSLTSKSYPPEDLEIVATYRFEGMTDPQDDAIVFAIEAKDGNKGTLIMSYSSKHSQNVELIKQIPEAKN